MQNSKIALFFSEILTMDFFERVKLLTHEKNMNLQPFIESLGINYGTYKSGRRFGNLPRADEAYKIAHSLHTSVDYLVSGIEPDTSRKYIDRLEAIKDLANKPI